MNAAARPRAVALPIELHQPIAKLAIEQLVLGYRAVIVPPAA